MAALHAPDNEIETARALYDARRARSKHFPDLDLAEPFWDILLFLFINQHKLMTTNEVCEAASTPRTTALRYVRVLADKQLIERLSYAEDARVHHIRMSPRSLREMRLYLAATQSFSGQELHAQ